MDVDEDVNETNPNVACNAGGHLTSLTGFLFGNIDDAGRLVDDDVLDEESRRHLDGLTTLGAINSLVNELTDDGTAETVGDNDDRSAVSSECFDFEENRIIASSDKLLSKRSTSVDDDYDEDYVDDVKADNAVDYSDITETVDDTEGDSLLTRETDNDKLIMPPPSWIPTSSAATEVVEELKPITGHTSEAKSEPSTTSQVLNTPLAALLPPQMAGRDVREWFPQFRPGQVLRFSRLFRPTNVPHIWKRKKRKLDVDKEVDAKHQKSKTSTSDAHTKGVSEKNQDVTETGSSVNEAEKENHRDAENGEQKVNDLDDIFPFKLNLGRPARKEELLPDEEVLLLSADYQPVENGATGDRSLDTAPNVAEWRFGPAKLWYDMIGVKDTGEGFDYGFKLKTTTETESQQIGNESSLYEYPDDAYHMVTQAQWEDEVIWNGDECRQRVMESVRRRGPAAGWIPSLNIRTMQQYWQQVAVSSISATERHMASQLVGQFSECRGPADQWYSIFPVENEALLYGRWEDDVIWDAQAMDQIPQPPVLTLDPNDENLILEIPEDLDPKTESSGGPGASQELASKKETKKSKMLLGKAGIIKDEDDNEQDDDNDVAMRNKDPFNLSNDEYYYPKLTTDSALGRTIGSAVIQHSTPAVELYQPFFLTHLGVIKLRNFHRPPLKRYSHGPMASSGPHPVLPLLKQIRRKEKLREQERLASGGGEMFFMRTPEDLTGRDGEIVLAEFSEQFPPLMSQVGMACKVKNYFKRRPGKDANPPVFRYGDITYAHTSPFLGSLSPGQCLQTMENNMFRAPVFEHRLPSTDFLIIRNRLHFYVREVETIFAVGQECPMIEVPGPNSKRANNFSRDFLQVFIYRLFWNSRDVPRRIKMEDVRKAFPSHSESSIRKRLKLCADFKRTGTDSNWWVLKSDFRLPTEEEIRANVSPEQCCAYYAMLAAEQRLKDAGYGERSLFAPEDDDEESAAKIEDEVKAAPWNTTRAFIAAMKGRCLLALTGVADPTGCGEGFSYVKVPNKPAASRTAADEPTTHHTPVKRTVTGTDADLRRLSLKDAKALLRKFGLNEADIKKLSRWEVIDVVRTMSTEQAKAAAAQEDGDSGICKFARGNRFSVAEHQERYKEECQRIFDLQNRILASDEVLSTDDDSSSDEDFDFEEMSRNIESMLSNKKTSRQINLEREEAERLELRRLMRDGGMLDSTGKDRKGAKGMEQKADMMHQGGGQNGMRKLKITRTFRNEDGREYTRVEMVSKPSVIDIYTRIRETKDPAFIRQFATIDDQVKEEMKKERRRIQEQLRRIKRIQATGSGARHSSSRDSLGGQSSKKQKLTPLKLAKLLKAQKLTCGACGQTGHMRTNRECPLYTGGPADGDNAAGAGDDSAASGGHVGHVALSEEQEEQLERSDLVDEDLINIEGIKMKISKQLVMHTEQVKRRSLVLKFPKVAAAAAAAAAKKRRRGGGVAVAAVTSCDYLKKPTKQANRRRADPVVSLSTILESVLNEMRDLPNVAPFLVPVNAKLVPDYHTIVRRPMDLQTIRANLRARKYQSREEFLVDVGQIVDNCSKYNGPRHAMTATAQRMLDLCLQRVAEKEEKLMRLEKAINPLLDDDDKKAIKYLIKKIVEENLKSVEGSFPFHNPVNRKIEKNYYEMIRSPMDLSTINKKADECLYRSRAEFMADVDLMVSNCEKYNGTTGILTQTAHKIQEAARIAAFEMYAENFQALEDNLQALQQAALDAVDTDSVITGTSAATGDVESVAGFQSQQPTKTSSRRLADDDFDESKMVDDDGEEEEEDVDVVGEDEMMDADDDDHSGNEADHNTLAHDLQLSPENSSEDDEREEEQPSVASPSRSVGRLSSDSVDQDFENADDDFVASPEPVVTEAIASYGVDDVGVPMTFGVPYVEYDDNAQDFVSYVDVGDGMVENVAAFGAADDDEDGGLENFDPQSFFSSIAQGVVEEQQHHASADINNDLQVSESDDSAAGDDAADDAEVEDVDVDDPEAEFVSVDDNDDADFDMTEFLQRPPSRD